MSQNLEWKFTYGQYSKLFPMIALFLQISSLSKVDQKARKINWRGKKKTKTTKQTNMQNIITLLKSEGEARVTESYSKLKFLVTELVQFE